VDNDRFQAAAPQAVLDAKAWRRELGIAEEAMVVLFAGKLETKKRPMDLLVAFNAARESMAVGGAILPALLFVGSGEWEKRLRAEAGVHIGKTVFFAPFQNQSQMPRVYAAAELLVLPSCTESETWGLAVNEAMNLGKPALVSSHVGCGPDLVQPHETGWVFEAGDVESLKDSLVRALRLGRDGLEDLGRKARARVDGYAYGVATSQLVAILRKGRTPSDPPKALTKESNA
jgi:glycosyltransferase involved in cell wall biosynthesis